MARTHRFARSQSQVGGTSSAFGPPQETHAEPVSWNLMGQLNLKLGGPRQFKARSSNPSSSGPTRPMQKLSSAVGSAAATPGTHSITESVEKSGNQTAHAWCSNSASSASELPAWPAVSDVELFTTLEQLRRYGLAFVARDLDTNSPAGVTRRALNRERKRLLAKNHPDRAHASRGQDHIQALADLHARFTSIADLFDRLMLQADGAE